MICYLLLWSSGEEEPIPEQDVNSDPLLALLCTVDVKDGSAQFVLLYNFLRIFTFSFYSHNVCTIYIRQKNTLDIGHRCTNLLQDTLSTADPAWPVEILRNTEVNKGRLNNPRRRKNTAGDELEFVTDWEKTLTVLLCRVFCSLMSNPWKIRWTILEPG